MNLVRLEPNLWIKSSDAHHKITARLKELFGESMGAEVGQIGGNEPKLDLNDERVLRAN